MKILGIDQGLENTGWSISEFTDKGVKVIKKGIILAPMKTKNKIVNSRQERLAMIFIGLTDIFQFEEFEFIVCEQINGNRVKYVGMVSGLIHMLSGLNKKPILDFVPSSVKKNLTESGKADKELMIETVNKITGESIKIEHIADSVAIAKKGYDVINGRTANDGDERKIIDYVNQMNYYDQYKGD